MLGCWFLAIVKGDALEIIEGLELGSFDHIVTDPPFLSDLGYEHKEDCTYIKNVPSSPLLRMARHGEYFSIRKKGGVLRFNEVRIPLSDEDNVTDGQIIDWFRRAANKNSSREIYNYLHGKEVTKPKIKYRETAVAGLLFPWLLPACLPLS